MDGVIVRHWNRARPVFMCAGSSSGRRGAVCVGSWGMGRWSGGYIILSETSHANEEKKCSLEVGDTVAIICDPCPGGRAAPEVDQSRRYQSYGRESSGGKHCLVGSGAEKDSSRLLRRLADRDRVRRQYDCRRRDCVASRGIAVADR